ncbi:MULTISPECIES: NAD(P)-binding domain-containing protein [Cyanophyceae]|uniref:NAD(P)-binding domain-containing protein n=1 Tax=Cyanophyceae TaxID=3028117 RepID=UPI001688F163|nr:MULTISPECIES: NAD(P)-binding domain-containing protein [unclassified Phormidium]MBD1919131.1 NAD(P)-dependent oxidoreductase [Phormidium sp. FACHB-77]MBD2033132.1 NAD(P)-dependent oxidoreductase [Phormidium sp. FACHB-322]MBD2054060.1 NAD(P)-dependent oxidoreductase [Leptolyngbya sp. FACHB-60]
MNIGIIGTGLMGSPMALRLLSAGHKVWVYNRTPARLIPLELAGAKVCATPLALIQNVEAVIFMVTNGEAVRSLLEDIDLGDREASPDENRPSPLADKAIIQMGTIAPAESQQLGQMVAQAGGTYLEAPVLGSIPEAKNGKLIIMAGAENEAYQRWQPLLECLGTTLYHVGPVGSAATLKLTMNQLIGSLTAAFAQSLGLVQATGINVDIFMAVLRQSALYAPTFDKKLHRMQTRQFADPNFPTKHLLKDMGLFVSAAKSAGLSPFPAESVRQLVEQAVQAGFDDDDYAALFNIVSPIPKP